MTRRRNTSVNAPCSYLTTTSVVGKPVKRGAGWFVPSGAVGYHVEHVEGRWRCTCSGFRWTRKGTCKHIQAVKKEVQMG